MSARYYLEWWWLERPAYSCLRKTSSRRAFVSYQLFCHTLRPLVGLFQAATLPISLLSKAPQILSNHYNQSTGNLSAFAVFNALLGCLARLFTTKQEVNDPLIFWGFAGAAVLNAILVVQMLVFWKSGDAAGRFASSRSSRERPTEEGIADFSSENVSAKLGEDSIPGRRWARKLD
jgi:mannose-P-dolichol utilization defect protein 1